MSAEIVVGLIVSIARLIFVKTIVVGFSRFHFKIFVAAPIALSRKVVFGVLVVGFSDIITCGIVVPFPVTLIC